MKVVGTLRWEPSGIEQEATEELTLTVHSMIVDLEHDQLCGGQAECGTCRVRVLSGAENLSPVTPGELELRRLNPGVFQDGERLACMARPNGDVVVELPGEELEDLR
jgi:ferredoxin